MMEERPVPGSNHEHDEQPISRQRAADISSQFPGSLNDAELEQVVQRIERLMRAIEELRRFPLDNHDEPAPVFRPVGKEQQ
jgi:hypothetical protein